MRRVGRLVGHTAIVCTLIDHRGARGRTNVDVSPEMG